MITGKRKSEIVGFDNYQITMSGEIHQLNNYSLEYDVFGELSKRIDRAGYYTVRLSKEGKTYTKYLHRLLAEAFIPNPKGLKFVNHKDGNTLNNRLDNLEWASHAENVQHAYDTGLIKPRAKPVIDTCSGLTFKSSKEASKHFRIKYNTLRNYLNGGIKPNPTCLKYFEDVPENHSGSVSATFFEALPYPD